MRTLIHAMGVSLDGSIGGPSGEIDWSKPGEELHRSHNDRVHGLEGHLLGRRLYETMTYFKAEGDGEWGVGGARLAHALLARDLIDECQLFVYPIVLGEGIPLFPALDRRLGFELVETRTFPGGVVYLRQRRAR